MEVGPNSWKAYRILVHPVQVSDNIINPRWPSHRAGCSHLGRAKISLRNGITVDYGAMSYALDPRMPSRTDYTFVSHAHLDHVQVPDPNSKVLASKETGMLAKARGFDLGRTTETAEDVKLLDSGHILGSRAICIGDEVLYTGDAAGRDRAFLGRCRTKEARILITESTFGKSNYIFPPVSQVVKEVNSTIGTLFDKGRPVVLMGYALGKSQILSHLFSSWSPFYVHERVSEINDVYRLCGVNLRKGKAVKADLEGLSAGPWVMVAPMMSSRQQNRPEAEEGARCSPGRVQRLGRRPWVRLLDWCRLRLRGQRPLRLSGAAGPGEGGLTGAGVHHPRIRRGVRKGSEEPGIRREAVERLPGVPFRLLGAESALFGGHGGVRVRLLLEVLQEGYERHEVRVVAGVPQGDLDFLVRQGYLEMGLVSSLA